MSFKKLLLQNDMKKPKIKQKNGKRTIYVNYNEKVFDAKSLEELRKEINYIYENNTEPISNENSCPPVLKGEISTFLAVISI